jgi:hypothetical protein
MPPQYLKAPHQLLAFVRRCQAPPKRGQHCPRVCRRRIRHRSQRELALSLPAAEPIECLVAIGDNAITTVNRVKDRARPLRHGAASRYVRNSRNPQAAPRDIDITARRSEVRSRIGPHQFAAKDQTDPAACGPPRLRRTLAKHDPFAFDSKIKSRTGSPRCNRSRICRQRERCGASARRCWLLFRRGNQSFPPACLRASLRRRRTASDFSRAACSDGFS